MRFRAKSRCHNCPDAGHYQPEPLRWALANQHADALRRILAPACERLSILGAIRRFEPIVRTVTMLANPLRYRGHDRLIHHERLAQSILDDRLYSLHESIRMISSTPESKSFLLLDADGYALVSVELHVADEHNWGLQQLLHTGPGSFTRRCVTPVCSGGWLRDEIVIRNGYVHDTTGRVSLPDERTFFDRCLTISSPEPRDRAAFARTA